MLAVTDITISGEMGDITGTTYGIFAMEGTITIDGQVTNFSGQCPIRAGGNIGISGDVGIVTGNGGASGNTSSYGIRTDGGKIKISSVIGTVSASSEGADVAIMAMVAKDDINER